MSGNSARGTVGEGFLKLPKRLSVPLFDPTSAHSDQAVEKKKTESLDLMNSETENPETKTVNSVKDPSKEFRVQNSETLEMNPVKDTNPDLGI